MRVKVVKSGGRYGDGFNFICADCEEQLEEEGDLLEHPKYETGFWGGDKKDKPLVCPSAGCTCANPLIFDMGNIGITDPELFDSKPVRDLSTEGPAKVEGGEG